MEGRELRRPGREKPGTAQSSEPDSGGDRERHRSIAPPTPILGTEETSGEVAEIGTGKTLACAKHRGRGLEKAWVEL